MQPLLNRAGGVVVAVLALSACELKPKSTPTVDEVPSELPDRSAELDADSQGDGGRARAPGRTADREKVGLEVSVEGKPPATWRYRDLDSVARVTDQEVWSIRDLVERLVHPGARVTELRDVKGKVVQISEASWGDRTQLPVLKLNRRGQFKFWWTAADRPRGGAAELQDVRALRVIQPR